MEKKQIIMEMEFSEYEALRQEIIANAGIIADVFTISITAAVVILGYGIQREQETRQLASVSVSSWDIGSLTVVYILTTGVNSTNRDIYSDVH